MCRVGRRWEGCLLSVAFFLFLPLLVLIFLLFGTAFEGASVENSISAAGFYFQK